MSNTGFANSHYGRVYREVANHVSAVDTGPGVRFINVDLPGLEGALAFPVGGLTVITGWSGSGKSVLCDNIVAKADVPVIYFPLQSTSLESAHKRLCAVEAGLDYWESVVCWRTMSNRIALAEASERLLESDKVLVCFDEVTPSGLNEALLDLLGESDAWPGTIDERADECLIVLDDIFMLAANTAPMLYDRIRFCKDSVKAKRAAFVVVSPRYDGEQESSITNADEIYDIRLAPIAPIPLTAGEHLKREPEGSMRMVLDNIKTSRYDGHPSEVEFVIDLATRTVHGT